MTPFARLLLVLIILAPLAYIGASYYNGEDGIQNIKNLLGFGENPKTEKTAEPREAGDQLPADVATLQQEVEDLREQVKTLEAEKKQLELDLREKELEIRELKLQEK